MYQQGDNSCSTSYRIEKCQPNCDKVLGGETYSGHLLCTHLTSDVLTEFLEVAFHSILYVRNLYPANAFKCLKKYNVPVQICIHSGVLNYIKELLESVVPLLEKFMLDKIVFTMLDVDRRPVERFAFEVAPSQKSLENDFHLVYLEQSLRAFLLKINTCDSQLCKHQELTWTVELHTKDSSAMELQTQQLIQDFTWVEADESQTEMTIKGIVPLRTEDTVIGKMQLYVEEGKTVDSTQH